MHWRSEKRFWQADYVPWSIGCSAAAVMEMFDTTLRLLTKLSLCSMADWLFRNLAHVPLLYDLIIAGDFTGLLQDRLAGATLATRRPVHIDGSRASAWTTCEFDDVEKGVGRLVGYNSSSSTKSRSPFAPLHRTGTSLSDSSADSWVAISTSSAPASPSPAAQYIAGWNASADDIHVYGRQTQPPTTPPAHVSTTSRSTNDARFLSRHIEFRGPSLDIDRAHAGTPIFEEESSSDSDDGRLKPSTYRKEERQGWSGEWTGVGAGGMDDVVARLRGMKTK
ncbi:hypothetical protein C8F01DRAFT_1366799 [Mycena amicta]|nr:hypothetical protein C8F01DRAFT_1366799 [Mycena amicta]